MTIRRIFVALLTIVMSASAAALEKKKFCMYDPVGKNGPAMTFFC